MPENVELPPVLEILGDDLYLAMKAADDVPVDAHGHWLKRHRRGFSRAIPGAPRVSMRWVTAGAAAVAVAVASLVLGTGGGPPNAFAGWTALPSTLSRGQLQAAESACGNSARALASRPATVADGRGPFSMLVYGQNRAATVCMTGLPGGTAIVIPVGGVPASVNPDAIAPEAGVTHQTLRQRAGSASSTSARSARDFGVLTGQVGANVRAVTLVLDNGNRIETTVAHGWFAAWWPGTHAVQSAAISTTSGTATQPLNTPTSPAEMALNFSTCMRSHGLANFPGPPAGSASRHADNRTGLDTRSPRFLAALSACRLVLAGKGG
jgi:hypothetical protein